MKDNAQIVQLFIDRTINQGDFDAADEYVWDDVVEEVPFPGQGPGLAGLKDVLRGLRTAFPDMHWTVQEQISEGDKVLTRFAWTGTQQGDFLGVPASGQAVSVWGMVIDRLVEGKIKNTRIIMDALGLMAQLGAFPPPKPSEPEAVA